MQIFCNYNFFKNGQIVTTFFRNTSNIDQSKNLLFWKSNYKPPHGKGSPGFVLNTNLHKSDIITFKFIIIL